MENKINIAQLLKDCPQGMELDCVLYDDVTLECVSNDNCYPIKIHTPEYNILLNKYGGLSPSRHAKCVIFPKGKTSWEGFVSPREFKDGDIVVNNIGKPFILKFYDLSKDNVCTYCGINCWDNFELSSEYWTCARDIRYATEEEKAKLFDAIKANGYKWDEETKILEKLVEPKFKVGDRIQNIYNGKQFTITKIYQDYYECDDRYVLTFENQDIWELVPDKFDITTLKPFDKVLTRDNDSQKWDAELFSFYNNESEDYHFQLVGVCSARYCIPYEENKHLLGTTNDCDDFYKTWE